MKRPPSTTASARLGCRPPREKHPPPVTAAARHPAAQRGHRLTRSLNTRHGHHPHAVARPSPWLHTRQESPVSLLSCGSSSHGAVQGRAATHLPLHLPMRPRIQCGIPITHGVRRCTSAHYLDSRRALPRLPTHSAAVRAWPLPRKLVLGPGSARLPTRLRLARQLPPNLFGTPRCPAASERTLDGRRLAHCYLD